MMKRLLAILILLPLLTGCGTPSGNSVDTNAKKPVSVADAQVVDVVGVLVGYHTSIPISTGERVFTFTLDPEKACCSEVYLFSVITPADIKGRYFDVHDVGPSLKSPELLFSMGKRYRFKLRVQSTSDSNPWIGTSEVEPGVREVSISQEEADALLAKLNKTETFEKKRLASEEERLKRNDLPDSETNTLRKGINTSRNILRHIEERKKAIADELTNARDAYPDLHDLKWKLLEDEGWQSVPRQEGVAKKFDSLVKEKESQQNPGGDSLKAAPQE